MVSETQSNTVTVSEIVNCQMYYVFVVKIQEDIVIIGMQVMCPSDGHVNLDSSVRGSNPEFRKSVIHSH
jgi:hypothetical protein